MVVIVVVWSLRSYSRSSSKTKFMEKGGSLSLFLPLVSYGETDELLFAGFAMF